jgi:hypothetical protein
VMPQPLQTIVKPKVGKLVLKSHSEIHILQWKKRNRTGTT